MLQKGHVRPAPQPLELSRLLLVLKDIISCLQVVLVALARTQFVGHVEELELQLDKVVPETLQFVLRVVEFRLHVDEPLPRREGPLEFLLDTYPEAVQSPTKFVVRDGDTSTFVGLHLVLSLPLRTLFRLDGPQPFQMLREIVHRLIVLSLFF